MKMISENIKKIKKYFKFSNETLAEKLKMPARTLGAYEREETTPSITFVTKLYNELNININWFISGSGDMFNKPAASLKQTPYVDVSSQTQKSGDRLINIQDANDLSNSDMANLIQVSEKTYIKMAANKEPLTIKDLNNIKSNFYNVDTDWLLYGHKKSHTNTVPISQLTPEQYQKLLSLLGE